MMAFFYTRSLLVSLLATALDYAVAWWVQRAWGVAVPEGTLVGASAGLGLGFWLNRYWVFRVAELAGSPPTGTLSMGRQLGRYVVGSAGSALLNILGTWALAPLAVPYLVGRLSISLLVYGLFTIPLSRRYVFRV